MFECYVLGRLITKVFLSTHAKLFWHSPCSVNITGSCQRDIGLKWSLKALNYQHVSVSNIADVALRGQGFFIHFAFSESEPFEMRMTYLLKKRKCFSVSKTNSGQLTYVYVLWFISSWSCSCSCHFQSHICIVWFWRNGWSVFPYNTALGL